MIARVTVLAVALGLAAGAIGQEAEAPPQPPPAVTEVNQMLDALVAAAKGNDPGAFVSYFAEQVAVASVEFEGQNFMFRRDEFADTMASYWMGAQATKAGFLDRRVRVNGRTATVVTRFLLESDALPMPLDADVRLLLIKQNDSWKIACICAVLEGLPVTDPENAQVKKVAEAVATWPKAFESGDFEQAAKCISPEAFGGAVDAGIEFAVFPNKESLLNTVGGFAQANPAAVSKFEDLQVTVVGSTAMATASWKLDLQPLADLDLQVTFLLAKPMLDWEIIGMVAGPRADEQTWQATSEKAEPKAAEEQEAAPAAEAPQKPENRGTANKEEQ